ncbi:hypothetical protein SPRG_20726 [Saprolegnia parasitica CBS 223.65]|uniref:NAD(+) ADP-ribosyltransferase n=1 Tax=Saprolegnia parasitica (strain CBS 223.65) TaxID=695850 RepID=A0A067CES8_SAPPC|nr:hypothetical protein SPRG_20726 [Saprolegnia parasitica CBS 223.65]KDO25317.1 hypothetical protein SPRG_20726 [Saprolegnia parasitica CBS 223.65]|eukprot:XP_012204017.1 hypothetical protein SPRG_20726 [Saprolegnia parasitica CBS 223.65]
MSDDEPTTPTTRRLTRSMTKAGVTDDTAPSPKKAKKTAKAPAKPVPKLLYGQIDPIAQEALAAKGKTSLSLMLGADGARVDASLALVDIAKNMDKYYLLQAIRAEPDAAFFVFARWGRTGSAGQSKLEGPFSTSDEAQAEFDKKFLEKTGQAWAARSAFEVQTDKYDLLHVDYGAKNGGLWEYYMDDHVDGKATGWYAYTDEGVNQTEMLWSTFQSNQAYNRRIVASGYFSYMVDLQNMTQMNISSNKTRHIRRTFNGIITASAAAQSLPIETVAPPADAEDDERDSDNEGDEA